jgi:SAM-dependent methyltransferase
MQKALDDTTRKVSEMYAKFPYPSPQARRRKLKELANLLSIFSMETRYDFSGKSVLDAGTGTGQRLNEAAAVFKNTRFVAVDVSEPPLAIARQAAANEGIHNVEFQLFNLMEEGKRLGTFDVILCMGVIHHLADPAKGLRNLVHNLAEDGILFMYIYGKHGGYERMRRKQIAALLLGDNRQDFHRGIAMVKDLGFDSFNYGWNLDFDDEESRNALIVDAYLNVNETLFDADSLLGLMQTSGLHGFLPYGLALDQHGCLFETRLGRGSLPMDVVVPKTDVSSRLPSPLLRDHYERLSLLDKYRLIDVLFQPGGYTVMGFKAGAMRHFAPDSRILANALSLDDFRMSSAAA